MKTPEIAWNAPETTSNILERPRKPKKLPGTPETRWNALETQRFGDFFRNSGLSGNSYGSVVVWLG